MHVSWPYASVEVEVGITIKSKEICSKLEIATYHPLAGIG